MLGTWQVWLKTGDGRVLEELRPRLDLGQLVAWPGTQNPCLWKAELKKKKSKTGRSLEVHWCLKAATLCAGEEFVYGWMVRDRKVPARLRTPKRAS